MYVRMLEWEKCARTAEACPECRTLKVVFDGWFPPETDKEKIMELLKDGAPGVARELCPDEYANILPENAETLVEFREEIDGETEFRKISGEPYEPAGEELMKLHAPGPFRAAKDTKADENGHKDCLMLVLMPGERPYAAYIKDELKELQHAVRGFIEFTYPFPDNCVVIGNDEAKLIGMKGNRRINGEIYAGPLLIAGDDMEGGLCGLTPPQLENYCRRFARPEKYTDEEVENSIKIEVYVI